MIERGRILIASCFLAAVAGCASYGGRELPAVDHERPVWSGEASDVQVGVVVIGDARTQKEYFDEDLTSLGVLPVRVIVRNRGPSARVVDPSDVRLLMTDGRHEPPRPVGEIEALIESEEGRNPSFADNFYEYEAPVVGMIRHQKTRRARYVDYSRKALKYGVLPPGGTVEGVAFYDVPANVQRAGGPLAFDVNVPKQHDTETLILHVAVSGHSE
jgi:hypothetical protein